jgi:(R,R)-butanediol dehydrogenase/meso-butanediol dehydrogenase/diacetyl reductase
MLKEITMVSSLVYNDDDFRETVEQFVGGAFKGVEKMVTDRIYLDDVVEKGFEALVESKDDHIKILVTPHIELIQ